LILNYFKVNQKEDGKIKNLKKTFDVDTKVVDVLLTQTFDVVGGVVAVDNVVDVKTVGFDSRMKRMTIIATDASDARHPTIEKSVYIKKQKNYLFRGSSKMTSLTLKKERRGFYMCNAL